MKPSHFSILAAVDPSRVSRLAKSCRILQNPRTRDVLTDHPLTRGFLLSRFSVLRAEMAGYITPPPAWKLAVAIIDGRRRAVVGWPDIPSGGEFAQWLVTGAELDGKTMTATIGGLVYPVTIEIGEKR